VLLGVGADAGVRRRDMRLVIVPPWWMERSVLSANARELMRCRPAILKAGAQLRVREKEVRVGGDRSTVRSDGGSGVCACSLYFTRTSDWDVRDGMRRVDGMCTVRSHLGTRQRVTPSKVGRGGCAWWIREVVTFCTTSRKSDLHHCQL